MAKKRKSSKPDTAVAVVDKGSDVPAYIASDNAGQEGLENMQASDLLIPRLIIMQGLSPLVTDGERKAGELVNSVTREMILEREEEDIFIPVYHYKEWIQWGDRESNEGIIDRTLDPDSELAQAAMRGDTIDANGKERRLVTEYHNFVVIIPSQSLEFPVILSCCRTNHKKGRALLALARYRGDRPLYAGRYSLRIEKERNRAGQEYFVYGFENAGWASESEYESAKLLYQTVREAYRERRIMADHSDSEDARTSEETEM